MRRVRAGEKFIVRLNVSRISFFSTYYSDGFSTPCPRTASSLPVPPASIWFFVNLKMLTHHYQPTRSFSSLTPSRHITLHPSWTTMRWE